MQHSRRRTWSFVILGAAAFCLGGWPREVFAQQRAPSLPSPPVYSVPPRGTAALEEVRRGLGLTTRVLVIAAHPDDEDTQLIAWLARGQRAITAYLSLTRGDGGQNLIGNELGEPLGVIRTQELLAARRIDGAHQYFTRAFDFGFSKDTIDTFKHWPHEVVLGDVVKVVRAFRPTIIVSVFSGTPRDGHGHHQVAGILAREAYDLAADTVRFPEREFGEAWKPVKFYRGARWARERATVSMNVGEYNANLGQSYAEIAADSRSQHKSQGFGTARRMGTVLDYLTLEASRLPESTPGGAETSIFENMILPKVWVDSGAVELAKAHVAVEAVAQREYVALGDSVRVDVSVFQRGERDSVSSRTMYVHGRALTQPYWLARPRTGALFVAASDTIPDDEREKQAWITVPIYLRNPALTVLARAPVVYHYADPVRGDVQRPLAVVPPVSIAFNRELELTRANTPFTRTLEITLRSGRSDPRTLTVDLRLPAGMSADALLPSDSVITHGTHTLVRRTLSLGAGETRTVTFQTNGQISEGEHLISAMVHDGDETFAEGYVPVEYDHITPQRVYRPAQLRIRSIDVAISPSATVGYVQGVGDNVAPALRELGVPVTLLDPARLPVTDLSQFSVIVVGPRAYQASTTLVENNGFLLEYARRGGHLVVQYGQYEMQQAGMMPYPITLARPATRVTDETAPVRVLDAQSRFVRTPNAITAKDFDGWIQERSVYMPSSYDDAYAEVFEMADPRESPSRSALLTTAYGEGQYTYVTLALFRQVPAGIAGGVRLFANLLTPARLP